MGQRGVSILLTIVAVLLFALAGLGVTLGNAAPFDLLAAGLATFALAHIVP